MQHKGTLADGSTACRWQEEDGDFIDVIASKSGSKEINKYSAGGRLKRHITLTQTAGSAYQSIELQGSGIVDYTLHMTLVEAQPAKEKSKVKNNDKLRRR